MATTTELNYPNSYNRELILDLTLQAFFVYDIDHGENAPRIHDYIPISKTVKEDVETAVLDSAGAVVTDGSGATVTVDVATTVNRTRDGRFENFKLLTTSGSSITLSEYRDYTFTDFVSSDGTGYDFDSYLLTGAHIADDFMRQKQAIYLLVYCKRTETVYTLDSSGSVVLARQSSCKMSTRWGFNVTAGQGKFGATGQTQAYRLFLPHPNSSPSSGDAFDYGPDVIITKNKLRGRGHALNILFESEAGKDMKLLGWGILNYRNDEP